VGTNWGVGVVVSTDWGVGGGGEHHQGGGFLFSMMKFCPPPRAGGGVHAIHIFYFICITKTYKTAP